MVRAGSIGEENKYKPHLRDACTERFCQVCIKLPSVPQVRYLSTYVPTLHKVQELYVLLVSSCTCAMPRCIHRQQLKRGNMDEAR